MKWRISHRFALLFSLTCASSIIASKSSVPFIGCGLQLTVLQVCRSKSNQSILFCISQLDQNPRVVIVGDVMYSINCEHKCFATRWAGLLELFLFHYFFLFSSSGDDAFGTGSDEIWRSPGIQCIKGQGNTNKIFIVCSICWQIPFILPDPARYGAGISYSSRGANNALRVEMYVDLALSSNLLLFLSIIPSFKLSLGSGGCVMYCLSAISDNVAISKPWAASLAFMQDDRRCISSAEDLNSFESIDTVAEISWVVKGVIRWLLSTLLNELLPHERWPTCLISNDAPEMSVDCCVVPETVASISTAPSNMI